MQVLVCYCVTDLSLLQQFCSLAPFTPLLNSPFLFFDLSFSWWAQYHIEWNMVNLGLPSWQSPLSACCHSHFWGRGKRQNFDSRVGNETYWILYPATTTHPIQKASSWRWQEAGKEHPLSSGPSLPKGHCTQSGVLQLEQLQSRRRKGGCLLW